VVCNTGVSLTPTVDGEMLDFTNAGLYDGLFVMQDTKTLTLWNHFSGVAMYGELFGRELPVTGVLLQMTTSQALEMDADMQVAISGRPFANSGSGFTATSFGRGGLGEPPDEVAGRGRGARGGPGGPGGRGGAGPRGGGFGGGGGPRGGPDAQLMEMFAVTLGEEDTRQERMTMGLGIWDEDSGMRRFYPFDLIRERGAFIDEVGGENLLVYFDPIASVPTALFVDANGATVENREVHLDNGQSVVASLLIDTNGEAIGVERPNQVFTRWYGFSLTFPNPEIYEQ
jgi:hypothetical protein